MAAPTDVIKDLLVAASVGAYNVTSGWNITIGISIDKPDTQIRVRQSGGQAPNPKWLIDYPSMQVIVRGSPSGYSDAWDKAQLVKDVLLGLDSQDIGDDRWVQVNMIGDISDIGQDELKRPMLSVNFALIIEPGASAATNREPLAP